jgi:hypothetical protein
MTREQSRPMSDDVDVCGWCEASLDRITGLKTDGSIHRCPYASGQSLARLKLEHAQRQRYTDEQHHDNTLVAWIMFGVLPALVCLGLLILLSHTAMPADPGFDVSDWIRVR